MNEDRKAAILAAAERLERAKMAIEMFMRCNTPTDTDERMAFARDRALAEVEFECADREYRSLVYGAPS